MMKLFTYDHCPYCVRARMALGLNKMEFATEPARAYFTRKKTESVGDFDAALANTPALKDELESLLVELEPLIQSPQAVHGEISYADIDLFGHLRGVTLVKDLKIPEGVRAYLDQMSAAAEVPLYDEMAS